MTDQEGLFTADPRKDPSATLLSVVEKITPEIRQIAGGSSTGLGTGGMSTKIIAADIATRSGVETIIASGSRENVLVDLANGQAIGSKFLVQSDRLEGRKQWLFGILEVKGEFARGELVKIFNTEGKPLALGLVRYGDEALRRIKGQKSAEIEHLLGYEFGTVAIHSDEMVVY